MSEINGALRSFSYPVVESGKNVEQRLMDEGYSKRLIIALKQTKNGLCVSGERVRSTYILKPDETLVVTLPQQPVKRAESGVDVPKLFEDEDILIFNKPAGMVCHRSGGHIADTLENTADGVFRAMNRLDRDTSGALVTAKHQLAAGRLWQKIQKRYIAVVQGKIKDLHGFITFPLAREVPYEPRQVVDKDGKPANTEYWVLGQNDRFTVVECCLHTGRMHQIRVHFSAVGYPLAGDAFYGGTTEVIKRQALHCKNVAFSHPITGQWMHFEAPIPADMTEIISKIGADL